MRKCVLNVVVAVILGFSLAVIARAQGVDWAAQEKALKSQQQMEWKALKTQEHNQKLSWKGQRVNAAERTRAKHEMERNHRDLKLRQKDAWQDLKDRRRSNESLQNAYSH